MHTFVFTTTSRASEGGVRTNVSLEFCAVKIYVVAVTHMATDVKLSFEGHQEVHSRISANTILALKLSGVKFIYYE
jgi:hypothetical protein